VVLERDRRLALARGIVVEREEADRSREDGSNGRGDEQGECPAAPADRRAVQLANGARANSRPTALANVRGSPDIS